MSEALARIPVGVVVERSRAQSEWADFNWRPVAVLPGPPDVAGWTPLRESGDRTSFYLGATEIELYRTETTNYRDNLATGKPVLWVALLPTGTDPPYELLAVTADPAEGECFTEAGPHLVDAVPMPKAIREAVEAFVAAHHVERAFHKRQRDRADPEALARRSLIERGQTK